MDRTDPPFAIVYPPRTRLPDPIADEAALAAQLAASLEGALDWPAVVAHATPWVENVRRNPPPIWAVETLLKEYPISRPEGLALMRLAEALLRVPDSETALALTNDQLGRANFSSKGDGQGWLGSLSNSALSLSKKFLGGDAAGFGLFKRLGAQTVVAATVRSIQLLGRQFVLGQTIDAALDEAASARKASAHARFSFDMLGEGARNEADAQRYLDDYRMAIGRVGAKRVGSSPREADGVSIKLSALYSRYEEAQHAQVMAVLLPRVAELVDLAAQGGINLTIDAEESERLELSLDVFEAMLAHIAQAHPDWAGFGLAIQAYQTRAYAVVEQVDALARQYGVRLMVRLVKGAYWDAEIKRAQELGLPGYPVFTHKHHTDLSYLACARRLLAAAPWIYPQFAGHNAGTIAAVLALGRAAGTPFEMQRLHGMGEGVFREVLADPGLAGLGCRVYAPVGAHRDLLAYLVRRLLENGANSSFVHKLADESVAPAELLASPVHVSERRTLPLPVEVYGAGRRGAAGIDLADRRACEPYLVAVAAARVPAVAELDAARVAALMQTARAAQAAWDAQGVEPRAQVLERAADALEACTAEFCGLIVKEARRSLPDALSEVREAVDFCRYYAQQARGTLAEQTLPGPTGESNVLRMAGRGVFACISPWNFPLAIFTGQTVAALVAGNAVIAKPAEQTPAVGAAMVALLHEAGVPREVLQLAPGRGETVGAALVAHPACAGVAFTGSTAVAKQIARTLAASDGPIVPLIAETGGINAMIVDSTALPEQVVDAVVTSAFRSAGQRCSALRILCVQDDIADGVIAMLAGAMAELRVGDPAELATDVGPVIDADARAGLERHIARLEREAKLIARTPLPAGLQGDFVAPVAFEVARVGDVTEEVFGPVLHVVRWKARELDALVDAINALGYGLTLGVQTRIDTRAQRIAARARVGNVYVNRNVIGAVVGVQPFGGEGLSGTGPKAGGPHYLLRFAVERTLTVNTAAAGGNAALFANWEE